MPSNIYIICNAYESGVGHGQKIDGHDNANGKLFSDPDCNEAYQIGYAFGKEKAEKKQKNSNAAQWEDFNKMYNQACEFSDPDDWMQAALYARQIQTDIPDLIPILKQCKITLLEANRNGFTQGYSTLSRLNGVLNK